MTNDHKIPQRNVCLGYYKFLEANHLKDMGSGVLRNLQEDTRHQGSKGLLYLFSVVCPNLWVNSFIFNV